MSIDKLENHQDDDIPLLEDVVAPEEVARKVETFNIKLHDSPEDSVPAYDKALLALRDEIMIQLEEDLRPIIAQAVDRAIAETTARIGQILHDELDNTLENHIRGLIAKHMENEFGPRERHLWDDEDI